MANKRFDIRRQLRSRDSLGGVITTSTAIETRFIDFQHLRGDENLNIGGLRIEANYRGFCHDDTNIRESDTITNDSGTTRFQVLFVQNLWDEHVEFFAKKVD